MAPGGDPIQAARNISREEDEYMRQRADDIRLLIARGLVHDLVSQLARIIDARHATGPEEVRLQDNILMAVHDYTAAIRSAPAALDYMAGVSPVERARQVETQSVGVAEFLKRAVVEQVANELDADIRKVFDEDNIGTERPTMPIKFGVLKTTEES